MLSRPWALLHFFLFAMARSLPMMEMAAAPGRSSSRAHCATIGQALRLGSIAEDVTKAQGLPNGGAVGPGLADPLQTDN